MDAIDSPFDMDYYKFTVGAPGRLVKVHLLPPDEYNYKLYLEKEDGTLFSLENGIYPLEPGVYYFIIASADNSYSNTNSYSLTVNGTPCLPDVNTYSVQAVYDYLNIQKGPGNLEYYVNTKPINFEYEYRYNVNSSAGNLSVTMSLTPGISAGVSDIKFVNYHSTFNHSSRERALLITLSKAAYSFFRRSTGEFQSTAPSMSQSMSDVSKIVIDADTGKAVDIYTPNFYYISDESSHSSYYSVYTE